MSCLADGIQPEPLARRRLELTQCSRRERARGRAGDGCVVEGCEKRASAERSGRQAISLVEGDGYCPAGAGSVRWTAAPSSSYAEAANWLNGCMRFTIRPAGSMTNNERLSTFP